MTKEVLSAIINVLDPGHNFLSPSPIPKSTYTGQEGRNAGASPYSSLPEQIRYGKHLTFFPAKCHATSVRIKPSVVMMASSFILPVHGAIVVRYHAVPSFVPRRSLGVWDIFPQYSCWQSL